MFSYFQNGISSSGENSKCFLCLYESIEQKIPVGDVLSGRVAPKFVERQLRPWVGEIPILRGLLRDKNSYWKFEKTGIDNADVRGEKFDAEAFRRDAADAVSAATPQAREGLMLGYESPEMLARRVGEQPKFDADIPFYVDEGQKRFADSSEFSDWVRAVDSGAATEFARLSDLPDAAKIWREEYLPAYAQKYGVRVGDVNAVVRSSDALDAARVRKMIDSIPDEEESLKLEAIGDADIEQLSDAHLEYAAERGQTWAADELVRRAEAENAAGVDSDDVFSRLDFEGAKLPTPEAMAQKGGSLSEEMKAVYDSLLAALKKKYFIDANVKLDEVAESLGYETEAELISALSDAAGRVADGYAVPRRAGISKPKQKGRKFLQDSVPANWEQYEPELPPSGYSESKSISESQDRNLKPRASIDVSRLPDLSYDEYANIVDRDSKDSPFGFVVYNGRDHYGEISDDTARKLGIPAGKIYLQNGRHDDSTDRGFGRVHIFKKHYSQFAQRGFETVEAFVENVFDNVTDIFKQGNGGKITLFVKNDNTVSRLDLRREIGGYSIQTAHMDRADRIQKKKTLLWEDGEVSSSAAKLEDPLGRMSITASKDYDKRTMGHGRVSDVRPLENASESQGKILKSFEKRDFKGVETDGFVPAAQASIEKSFADDAANAAKWVAMTPEERVAEACPDFTDKAIELSRAMARKNAGHPLPTYGGLKLELMALKSGKFKIVEDGKKLKPIKVFRDEAQAREFLGKWILAYADAGRITYYVPADVRGVFADAGGLSAENAYVRDAKGEIKVDGIVMRKAKPERLVRDVFVTNWDREYDRVRDEKAELEKLNKRDFENVDEFKRWLEKNSYEVEKKFGSIRMEYRFDKENLGKPAAEEEAEIARRQQFWLDNNIEDLARLYKARIKEEDFDFEDEVDVGDGLDWEDGADDGFGAPARVGTPNGVPIEKQYDSIRNRYADSAVWMKAPNGANSNLSENDWIAVRTPDFKAKFGDWERFTQFAFLDGNPVVALKGDEINPNEKLTESVMRYFRNVIGKTVFSNRAVSDIEIKEKSIKSSIAKGIFPEKKSTFAALGDVLERGIVVDFQKNWKGRGYDTAVIAAPVSVNEVPYVVAAVVELKGKNKFYVHDVVAKERLGNALLTQHHPQADYLSASRASVVNVLYDIFKVNKNISLALDENGEPILKNGVPVLKNSADDANNSFGSSGGGRMERSTDPYPPDLTMPKDGRFDPKRVDSSARKDYDASAAQEAFDEVWDSLGDVKRGYSPKQIREVEAKMRDFTKKMDARMLELPELIEFAERIISGKVRAVKGFNGDYLGMYYGGEKKIELRRDLFKLVGDCRRYEVALDAAREVLKKHGFDEEVVDSRRPDQIVQAVYENRLGIEYQTAFERKINVEFGKAKRNGQPSAALMVAAHEIMHAVDDIRADGSRLGKHSGGTLGAIVGEIPKCLTAVSKIRGWGDVLTPEIRKSISKCADFAAGKRPRNPEKLKEWRKYRNDYRQKELERFCAENRILTREVAVKELNEVIAWWQGLPSADMVGKYFQQPWERFAEAGAAFLCNTRKFAELAPNVYEAMLGNMRARPKFWQNWQEFQRRLDNPQGNARRTAETVKSGFAEARLADSEYEKSVRKADLSYLRQDLKTYYRTENAPLYDLAEKLAKRDGTPPPSSVEMLLSMPFIRPLVGRYIGVSDAGVREVARRAQEDVAADEAQRTLLRRGIVADAVRRGGDGRYEYAAERVAELPDANRQDYGYVRSRLRRADRRSSTAEAAVDDAPTRRQKEAVRAELERLRLIDSHGE